jgi:signal transduction histidine kinase
MEPPDMLKDQAPLHLEHFHMLKVQVLDKSANQCLGQVHDLLHQSISATRSLAVQLSPPCLYETGLTKAMEWLCDWMHQKHGLKIEMTSKDGFKDICEEIRVLLFQAARELLFNVSKHAGVNECKLTLLRADDQILMCVSDQGTGFDANTVCSRNSRKLDGFGLFSIRERLEYIGGCIDIKSSTGKGTIVCVYAPLVFKKQDNQIEITQNPTQDPTGWLWKE